MPVFDALNKHIHLISEMIYLSYIKECGISNEGLNVVVSEPVTRALIINFYGSPYIFNFIY